MHPSTTRRSARRWAALVAVVAIAAALSGSPASAHVPALEPAETPSTVPVPIGGPEISRAIYGYLEPGVPHDDYEFEVSEPVTRTVGVLVPAWRTHAGFRPTFSLVAEGSTPVRVPDPALDPRENEWEPFSLTSFWTGGERELGFVPGQRYLLRIEPGGGPDGGRYVIVFGGPEKFDAADVRDTLVDLPRIWFGLYGAAPFHWNWYAALLIAAALSAVAWVVVALWRWAGRASRP